MSRFEHAVTTVTALALTGSTLPDAEGGERQTAKMRPRSGGDATMLAKNMKLAKPQRQMHIAGVVAVFLLAGASAAPALALEFPMHANDLNPGERIVTRVHGAGGGPQTGAKDLRILRRVANNDWRPLKAGQTNEAVNSNYLVYRRPVYAMASGTVIGCWRNAPENNGHTQRPEVLGTKKILLQGNHLWIRQTD